MVGILLRLLLTFDVRSVADFSPVARGSPKSFKSQKSVSVDKRGAHSNWAKKLVHRRG